MAVAVAYLAAAEAGLTLSFATKQVSAVWPPAGIAVAVLLLRGHRVWPGIFLGAFISNAIADETVLTAAGIAVGNTVGPLFGAFLLKRVIDINLSLNRLRDVLGLAVLGAAGAMVISSANGVINLIMAGIIPWSAAWPVWWTWWVGDAMGVLIVTPVLLTWFSNPRLEWRGLRRLELFAALSAALVGSLIFSSMAIPYAYPVFPIVIWIALRFGQRESATAVLAVSIMAVWLTIHGVGPFITGTPDTRLMHLVTFMSVLVLTGLTLGATVAQRREAEASLLRERDARLRESDARFEGAFQGAAHGMALVSPEGRWVRVNAALCGMVGYSETELLATDFQSITYPEDLNLDLDNVNALLSGEIGNYQMEKRYVHKRGDIIWVLLGVSLVRSADGDPLHFVAQIIDITERKQTEQFLQLAMNGAGDGAWDMNLHTDEVAFTRRGREIVGLPLEGPQRFLLTDMRRRIHPDDMEKTLASRAEHERGHAPQYTNETRILLPDGTYRWILTRGVIVSRDREGHATRLVGTVSDLTAMRAAEAERAELLRREEGERRLIEFNAKLEHEVAERTEELNQVNTLLSDVLRSASEISIIATDIDGVITIFNAGAERMLGYSAAEMIGRQTPAVLHLAEEIEQRGAALTAIYGAPIEGLRTFVYRAEQDGAETRQWTYVRKDGGRLQVSLTVTAMRNRTGDITGYLGIAEDVTERERFLTDLRDAKLAAEAANAAKSQFLAMMSHELRTPMTGVLGMADLLLAQDPRPDQSDLLHRQIRAARTLLDLLNDVLDFAKAEAGRIEIEDTDFSVAQVTRDIESAISPLLAERSNVLRIDIGADVRAAYRGDAKRYQQILMNLVGNANKFTGHGTITVNIREERADENGIVLQTEVTDTGIGIPADVVPRLFKPFAQGDTSTSRKFGGTGLGLTISKSLTERMGGRIWVDSTPGKGSAFGFTVVLHAASADAAVAAASAPSTFTALADLARTGRPLRILHAEDSDTIRMITAAVLARVGHHVTGVEDGQKAVEAAACARYDIILMDMQMPVMDGPSAMRAIRSGAGPCRDTPAIALTADVIQDHHAEYLAAGTSTVITKPVDWKSLMSAIESLADATSALPLQGPAVQHQDSIAASQVFDPAMMEELGASIDAGALETLLTSFNANMSTYVAKIVDSVRAGDMSAVAKAAHTLKGTAAQFGATLLSVHARDIETAAKNGEPLTPLLSNLDDTVAATRRVIEAWHATRPRVKVSAGAGR